MDSEKMDSINFVKAIILVNNDFSKEFDKCVTSYKDFLKHY